MGHRSSYKSEHLLPGKITSIDPQKKRRGRYSIFIDGEFLIGLSETVLTEFKLQTGHHLDRSKYRKIKRSEDQRVGRDFFLKLLGQRDHTRKELLQKAFNKRINRELSEKILDEFEEKGWIDHRAFARNFIQDKFRLNQWGPRKIAAALQQKGVDSSLAEELIQKYFESVELLEVFLNQVDKKSYKFKRETNTLRRRKKVFDYLYRKGYYSQQILKHMDRLMKTLES